MRPSKFSKMYCPPIRVRCPGLATAKWLALLTVIAEAAIALFFCGTGAIIVMIILAVLFIAFAAGVTVNGIRQEFYDCWITTTGLSATVILSIPMFTSLF